MRVPSWALSALATAVVVLLGLLTGVMVEAIIENSRDVGRLESDKTALETEISNMKARINRQEQRITDAIEEGRRLVDETRRARAGQGGL